MLTVGLIIGTIALAIAGGLIPLIGMLTEKNDYGSSLERYIISRNPKTHAEVEKLQFEYDLKQAKDRFL